MTSKLKRYWNTFLTGKFSLPLAAFLFPLFIYLSIPPRYLLSADHYEKFVLGKSIFESGFRSLDVFYPGYDFDPELRFSLLKMSVVNGHKIIAFPVSLGILYAAAFPFGGANAIYFLSAFLIGSCLYLLGREFSIPSGRILLFSAATPIVMNGYLFMDVGVALFLFVSGSILYRRSRRKESLSLTLVATLLFSLTYWFRLEYLIFLGIYWFYETVTSLFSAGRTEERKKLYWIGTAALVLGFTLYCAFNYSFFRTVLGPRFNANYDSSSGSNLFKNFINFLFYGNLKLGLFGYSPFLLIGAAFSVYSFSKIWKKQDVSERSLISSSFLGIVIAAATAPNDGGAEFGARYLTPGIPGLLLCASRLLTFAEGGRKTAKIALYLILTLSVIPTWIYYKTTKGFAKNSKSVQAFISEEPKENLLIFQNGLIGGMAGPDLYFQGRVYQATNIDELADLLEKYSRVKIEDGRAKRTVPFEYFAYAKEYTEGMKNLEYDPGAKAGLVEYLSRFDSETISKLPSFRITGKKRIGSIEILYGNYETLRR
ncbi:hypothetical protein EHQ12_12015 [Leptospira gomenensis]|uniref:LA_3751/LA_3752 family putative glycosyltransferase n=1 Tax=Leptospira gomenensis TaxID=2484974 RepID=UPI001090FAB3|nr:hypothetical protein [Leptospira gomenensis]TGK36812.1 hypothetical protein EHQ12_12015 [Leptospira gomenensis]